MHLVVTLRGQCGELHFELQAGSELAGWAGWLRG